MSKTLSEQVAELQELFDRVALECDQRGETIAELEAKQHHLWDVKEAIRVENFELWSKNERLEAENAALRAGRTRWPGETIASEDVPFKGMTDLRYKVPDDDFPCCEDTTDQLDTVSPELIGWREGSGRIRDGAIRTRLSVHALNVAPVGSTLANGKGFEVTKDARGDWVLGHHPHNNAAYKPADLMQWSDATLTYPEDQS